MTAPIGVLVMAYGTANGPEDVERYYTDIRGGRPPAPGHLEELKARYAAIGNRFPLLEITREQAASLEHELNAGGGETYRAYLGMKHSPPFIAQAVEAMRAEGIERAVGIVMAPHWSGMSVETYVERVAAAARDGGPRFTFVRSYHDHPLFVELLAARVRRAFATLPGEARERTIAIFTAHSLPVRSMEDGSQRCKSCTLCSEACMYREQLEETAELVSALLVELDRHTIGWQSAGRTGDPWWEPSIEDVIKEAAKDGFSGVVVCSAGFVADHLEILYDLDVEARGIAEEAGIHFARTEMPNTDPAFVKLLATVVREQVEAEGR